MKVLLLGGNGLLGHNVLKQLLQQGHEVHALLRSSLDLGAMQWLGMGEMKSLKKEGVKDGEKTRSIANSRFTLFSGSLLDDDMLLRAAQGCEAIINCAGVTDMSLLHYDDYLPVNRDLCHRLVNVMERIDIACLVHTSTANTIGYGLPLQPANEQAPMQPPFSQSYYAQSKREGEEILLNAARLHANWHIIVVNPGFMIGPFDTKPSSGALLLAGYRKPIMITPCGGKSFVHVADAATAIVNALTMGRSGRRYLLTGQNLSLKQFYKIQSRTCGYRQLLLPLPNQLLTVAGWCGDLLRRCGVRTQLSTRNVRQLMVKEYYDNTQAQHDLQLPQTTITQAITDFFGWYKTH
ncbi:MAG: NAD-dependent epimerase/dehydratase family protein [Bacteroidales bacterium]|nr:NAD-dependent epimerase/dehydratase family protein [Bacteroidales bacterium]